MYNKKIRKAEERKMQNAIKSYFSSPLKVLIKNLMLPFWTFLLFELQIRLKLWKRQTWR